MCNVNQIRIYSYIKPVQAFKVVLLDLSDIIVLEV